MDILIAEDHPSAALFLRRLLERLGHPVTVATDGFEAWQLACERPFRLIISDWIMPGLDGLELCRRIRARPGRSYTYLILLTSKHRQQERLEGSGPGPTTSWSSRPMPRSWPSAWRSPGGSSTSRRSWSGATRQLADLASSDELTGIHNRRRFREILDDACLDGEPARGRRSR